MFTFTDTNGLSSLAATIGRYAKLLLEDTRLNVAEKLTRLLSATALFLILLILVSVVMVFLSISVAIGLSVVMSPLWAFILVAAFYLVCIALLIICRKPLLINPIARFISILMLDKPQTPTSND